MPPPPDKNGEELSSVELQLSVLPAETLVWQKGPAIGSGRFGQVFTALRLPSAELLAVKQIFIQEELDQGNDVSSISLQRVQSLEQIEREVEILRLLQHHDHPNVVRFVGGERYGPTYNLFMEYLPAGSLSKLLKDFGAFDESMMRCYLRGVVCGVVHLHALGIAHRDLKCANLLLADDERGGVKIADFGTAKRASVSFMEGDADGNAMETARSVREGLGSPFWMAPELVRAEKGEDSWRKADIWGIGCVAIEMATGKPPWENLSNPLTAMFHIASATSIPDFPAHLSPNAHGFLARCFDKSPETRASATELLHHPFLHEEAASEAQSLADQNSSIDSPSGGSGERVDVEEKSQQLMESRHEELLQVYLVQWEQSVLDKWRHDLWFRVLARWVARARRTLALSRQAAAQSVRSGSSSTASKLSASDSAPSSARWSSSSSAAEGGEEQESSGRVSRRGSSRQPTATEEEAGVTWPSARSTQAAVSSAQWSPSSSPRAEGEEDLEDVETLAYSSGEEENLSSHDS